MRRRRKIVFRIAAMVLGLALLLVAELTCRALGWGQPETTDDPYVGFDSVVPLFVPSAEPGRKQIAKGRLRFFAPDSFPDPKPPGSFRAFCLGGSTVQGRPFSVETSFTTWLEQSLSIADPQRSWDIVNCGGVSYASYRLVPILTECLQYEPDLIIVCTGHNEFLEDRTYSAVKSNASLYRLLAASRIYTLLRTALLPDRGARDRFLLAEDVEARLDYQGGLDLYQRDDQWQDAVVRHFESNLRRMARMCQAADVPLLFMLPPSNLADSPPFKSQPDPAVGTQVRELIARASGLYRKDLSQAIEHLEAAVALDDRCAVNLYELARAYESAKRIEDAREYFIRARDEDVCPLRMISALETVMLRVAAENDVPLLDVHALLEARSRQPILGDGMLVDHIHPSFTGHQLIAHELVRSLTALGFLRPVPDWEERAKLQHAEHLNQLDRLYFLRGQRTLETLREWARGRGRNLPVRPSK